MDGWHTDLVVDKSEEFPTSFRPAARRRRCFCTRQRSRTRG